jgi:hypothetical protein
MENLKTYWNNQSRVCFFKFSLQPKEILITSPHFKFTGVEFPTRCLKKAGENNSPRNTRQKPVAQCYFRYSEINGSLRKIKS